MAKKTLTLIVVPDHDAPVRRFQLEKSLLRHAALGVGAVGLLVLGAVIHYFSLVREASENRLLRDENLTLRTQLKGIRERMEHIGATLERVERFDQKLRAVTLLSDPQRNLALGPTAGEPGVTPDPQRRDRVHPPRVGERDPAEPGLEARQADRVRNPPGEEPPGTAVLLPRPEEPPGIDPVGVARPRLGHLGLRTASRPVYG